MSVKFSVASYDERSAEIDGKYRYRLRRVWNPFAPIVGWVMLNPSTADGLHDDATIRKITFFARRWRYGGIEVSNLFGYRATDCAALTRVQDPVGPRNDAEIGLMLGRTSDIVCAWGTGGSNKKLGQMIAERVPVVLGILKPFSMHGSVNALRFTKDGNPAHPLYLPGELMPIAYPAARAR